MVMQRRMGLKIGSNPAQTLFIHELIRRSNRMPRLVSQVPESPLRTQISRFGTFLGQDVARFASAPWHPPP